MSGSARTMTAGQRACVHRVTFVPPFPLLGEVGPIALGVGVIVDFLVWLCTACKKEGPKHFGSSTNHSNSRMQRASAGAAAELPVANT